MAQDYQHVGGVRVKSKSGEVNIVWCHPSKGVELAENGTTEVEVWPVWLGLGPVAGTVVAMMKQGIQSPARLIYKVLTDLATITQVRNSSDLCYTEISEMRMGFPADWTSGGNTRVIFGWKESEKWDDRWVPAPLIWVCASLLTDLDMSPITTVLVKNGHTHLMHWNKRVPDQWVGWGAMYWDGILLEVAARKFAKRQVYWVIIGWKGVGGCRDIMGGVIRSKVGEWGGFTIWVVMSSDNGIQGAKVYGAKKIMNPWNQT